MRILVVDDSASVREQITTLLAKAFPKVNVETAKSGLEAITKVKDFSPDLIIMDIHMPEMTGYDALRILQAKEDTKSIPVIFLTGTFQEERDLVQGLEMGAVDYVIKPINEAVFLARVKVMMRLKSAQDAMRDLSLHDPLTSCYNRRFMLQRMKEELHRSSRTGSPLSGIMMDIDHFKKINDTYGHEAGDKVLVKTANSLRIAMRTYDVLARWGGEEFFMLLPNTNTQSARIMAERMRAILENTPVEIGEETIHVTASFGVAGFEGDQIPLVPNILINRADKALYEAKQQGRNRVVVFTEV